jgi:F-type H+-transporting ATPase subunit delta
MIKTAAQAKRKARQLFRFCFINGRLDAARVRHVVSVVLEFKRRGYIRLLQELQRLVRLEVKANLAEIESAAFLPPPIQNRVREAVESRYGTGIATLFEHNPGLIGGLRIRIGSDVYDGTVQAKLAALQKSFGTIGERQSR